jgi:hypothetical protein
LNLVLLPSRQLLKLPKPATAQVVIRKKKKVAAWQMEPFKNISWMIATAQQQGV